MLLIFIPAILVGAFGLFVQIIRYEPLYPKDAPEAPAPAAEAVIPIFDNDPILGSKRAPVTLIAFEDFGCAQCRAQFLTLQELMRQYPEKIKIVWKALSATRFPIPSETSHAYAFCANEEGKFEAFAAGVFSAIDIREETLAAAGNSAGLDAQRLASCLASSRPQAYKERIETLAEAFNIQAVPAIFLDGRQIDPPKHLDAWVTLLELPINP